MINLTNGVATALRVNLSLFQPFGNVLYAIGQILDVGAQGFFGAHSRDDALIRRPGNIQFRIGIGQFVGHQKRNHHQKLRLVHLADGGDEFADPVVDIGSQPGKMRLLTIVANDLVFSSVNGNRDLSNVFVLVPALVSDRRLEPADGGIEAGGYDFIEPLELGIFIAQAFQFLDQRRGSLGGRFPGRVGKRIKAPIQGFFQPRHGAVKTGPGELYLGRFFQIRFFHA